MDIREFFYQYRNITPDRAIDISYDNILQNNIVYGYKNIIYNQLPADPQIRVDVIWDIFINTQPGVSVYIDDTNYEYFIALIEQKFNEHKSELNRNNGDCGISIQHIYGVGCVISMAGSSDLFITKHYQLDEYISLSNEYVVLGMAKHELYYIKDWVDYHLRIGFDRIYLFDNNDIHGEDYNEILSEYINNGKVYMVDMRGLKAKQNAIYNSFYNIIPFKWMAIIDIDEFIWFKENGQYTDIKNFLTDKCMDSDRFGIMLQWHCYASSGDDTRSDKPIWEANDKLLPFSARKDCRPEYIHNWCKSIYKPGYSLHINEHYAWEYGSDGGVVVKENDYKDNPIIKDNLISINEEEFNNQEVYIKHFLLRNIYDFYHHKYLRGHAGGDFGTGNDGWRFWQWCQNINYYTDISNTLTDKEQLFLVKHGMKMNYAFHPDVFINWYCLPGNDYINNEFKKIITRNILPTCNAFVNQIYINGASTNLPAIITNDQLDSCDLHFLATESYHNIYFDMMMNGGSIRKNIQDPLIFNIGIPLKYAVDYIPIEEQKLYMETMSALFTMENVKNFLRAALDHEVTTIPMINIMDNPDDCLGYKDSIMEFLTDNNLSIPSKMLLGNTMIMSFSQYNKLLDFQQKFFNNYGIWFNDSICDNIKNNFTTPYHAYICSVMSVIDKPYYIWP